MKPTVDKEYSFSEEAAIFINGEQETEEELLEDLDDIAVDNTVTLQLGTVMIRIIRMFFLAVFNCFAQFKKYFCQNTARTWHSDHIFKASTEYFGSEKKTIFSDDNNYNHDHHHSDSFETPHFHHPGNNHFEINFCRT